jgi:hypothetical protein
VGAGGSVGSKPRKASGGIADMFLGLRIREDAGMRARTNINDLNFKHGCWRSPWLLAEVMHLLERFETWPILEP